MDIHGIDRLARNLARFSERRSNRRTVIKLTGAATAAVGLESASAAPSDRLQAIRAINQSAEVDPTIDAIAFALEYDRNTDHFVRL